MRIVFIPIIWGTMARGRQIVSFKSTEDEKDRTAQGQQTALGDKPADQHIRDCKPWQTDVMDVLLHPTRDRMQKHNRWTFWLSRVYTCVFMRYPWGTVFSCLSYREFAFRFPFTTFLLSGKAIPFQRFTPETSAEIKNVWDYRLFVELASRIPFWP
jgi:hypothetical protein